MKRFLIALLIASSPACSLAAPLNDLYFGYDMMRSSEVYWWFLADGRVLNGLPNTGLSQSDFENACASARSRCGNYSLSGTALVIQYRDGRSEKWQYKPLQGGFQMNYLILAPVQKAPAKLSGTWSRAFSSSFAGTTVTSPSSPTSRSPTAIPSTTAPASPSASASPSPTPTASPSPTPSPSPSTSPPAPVPQITGVATYQQGVWVYFDVHYADPGKDAQGFGFMGVNGRRWVEESYPFSAPNQGVVGPDSVAYPLDLECGTAGQHGAEIEVWVYDATEASSQPVLFQMTCQA